MGKLARYTFGIVNHVQLDDEHFQLTTTFSRKEDAPRPYSAITEDPAELQQLQVAENNPKLVLATDWTYLTAEEYHNVAVESGYNILYVWHASGI